LISLERTIRQLYKQLREYPNSVTRVIVDTRQLYYTNYTATVNFIESQIYYSLSYGEHELVGGEVKE